MTDGVAAFPSVRHLQALTAQQHEPGLMARVCDQLRAFDHMKLVPARLRSSNSPCARGDAGRR
jgi:hypothetical protein